MKDKDMGIKIGTKREAYWNIIKKGCEEHILNCEEGIIADKHMLKLAEKIIKEEEAKH